MKKFLNISTILIFIGILTASVTLQPVPKISTTTVDNIEYLEYQWFLSIDGYFQRDISISEKEDMYNHLFEDKVIYFILISLLVMSALLSVVYYLLGKSFYYAYCKFRVTKLIT